MTANVRHSSDSVEWYSPRDVVDLARSVMGGVDLDPFSSDEAQRVVRAGQHWTLEGARRRAAIGPSSCDGNGFTSPWGRASEPTRVFVNAPGGTVDDDGLPSVYARGGVAACGVSGSCGAPAPHAHVGRHSAQKRAWRKLVEEWRDGRVSQAVFLCFSLELLQVAQSDAAPGEPLPTDFPVCYPRRRLAYRRPSPDGSEVGASPPHASCAVYLPPPDPLRDRAVDRFVDRFSTLGRVVVPR